jgi:hypothetical protein
MRQPPGCSPGRSAAIRRVSWQSPASLEPRPLPRWFLGKVFIICTSFANLAFQNVWAELLNRKLDFYRKYAVTWQQFAAVTLDVLLLAVLLWIPVCLVAKSGNRIWIRILKWCVLAGLVLPFNVLRYSDEAAAIWALPALHAGAVRILLAVLGAAAGIVLLWKWERLAIPVTSTILLILAPMLPLAAANVAWDLHTGPPAGRFPDKPSLAPLPQKAGAPHVLWFIFDEWDESITFHRRPANIDLPELDRFRAQSFHAGRAYPPNQHETIISIPSLLMGMRFLDEKTNGASEMLLTYDRKQPPERLTADATLFSAARGIGFNAGIVGFHLPYCRILETTSCEWYSPVVFDPVEWEFPLSVGRFMVLAAKRQAPMLPFAKRLGIVRALGGSSVVKPSLLPVTYRQIREAALHSIVDSRLNVVFTHWNIPHPPGIYNAAKDEFSNGPASTYADNLRLLDRTVSEIRLALEKAGTWDSSTILLTSDHPLRVDNWRLTYRGWDDSMDNYTQSSEVPFLLKMAGQKQGFAYNAAMQTVVTIDLLLAIMKGEIAQPAQVAAWLDHNPPRR